jgi:hypothetical protein
MNRCGCRLIAKIGSPRRPLSDKKFFRFGEDSPDVLEFPAALQDNLPCGAVRECM